MASVSSPSHTPADCIFCKIIGRTTEALIIHEDDRTISLAEEFQPRHGSCTACAQISTRLHALRGSAPKFDWTSGMSLAQPVARSTI